MKPEGSKARPGTYIRLLYYKNAIATRSARMELVVELDRQTNQFLLLMPAVTQFGIAFDSNADYSRIHVTKLLPFIYLSQVEMHAFLMITSPTNFYKHGTIRKLLNFIRGNFFLEKNKSNTVH